MSLAYVTMRTGGHAASARHHREAIRAECTFEQVARAIFGYVRHVAASGRQTTAAAQLERLFDSDQSLPVDLRMEMLAECVGYDTAALLTPLSRHCAM